MNRRSIMVSAPAALAFASAIPASQPNSPTLRAFSKWLKLHREALTADSGLLGAEAFEEQCKIANMAEDELCSIPTDDPIDILAKIVAITLDGNSFEDASIKNGAEILAQVREIVHRRIQSDA